MNFGNLSDFFRSKFEGVTRAEGRVVPLAEVKKIFYFFPVFSWGKCICSMGGRTYYDVSGVSVWDRVKDFCIFIYF